MHVFKTTLRPCSEIFVCEKQPCYTWYLYMCYSVPYA